MIDGRERPIGPAHAAAGRAQSAERLRRRHLVHEVQVDVEQRLAVVELATTCASQRRSSSVRVSSCRPLIASTLVAWLPGTDQTAWYAC